MNKSVGVYFNDFLLFLLFFVILFYFFLNNIVVDRISVQTYENALSGHDNNYVISALRAISKNILNHEFFNTYMHYRYIKKEK